VVAKQGLQKYTIEKLDGYFHTHLTMIVTIFEAEEKIEVENARTSKLNYMERYITTRSIRTMRN